MKLKEESEKAALKLNIQKSKIMASGPTTSWQIDRERMESVTDFIFLGSKITTDGDCPAIKLKDDRFLEGKLWKILKEMGIPDHLRNLNARQEATVRTLRGIID